MTDAEFSSIKLEILSLKEVQQTYIIAMYTITIAILGYAIQQKNDWLFLLPYVILFSFQRIIDAKKYCCLKLSAYLSICSNSVWEKDYVKIEEAISKSYTAKKFRKFKLIRVSSLHLGLLCSFLCIISNSYKLMITSDGNFDFEKLYKSTVLQVLPILVSIILFILLIFWCSDALNSMETLKKYKLHIEKYFDAGSNQKPPL